MQSEVAFVLKNHGKQNLADILAYVAKKLPGVDASQLSRIIDEMIKNGPLKRVENEIDCFRLD